jgi:glucosamine-6-phosphate isomerase
MQQKKVFKDSCEASEYCAETLADIISKKPDALICLAAGHTSLEFFQILIGMYRENRADFSGVRIVGLDEWAEISGSEDGSCETFLRSSLFDQVNIKKDNIRLFDGKAADLIKECRDIDSYIEKCGGIDYMLLGIGMNGHLGLNEPGTNPESRSHIVELDTVTKKVAVKYFDDMPDISRGVTLGIKNILESGRIQLLITGENKKEIVKRLFSEGKTSMLPATLLKGHQNAEFILDGQAASLLD